MLCLARCRVDGRIGRSLLCSGDSVWSLGRFFRRARSRIEPTGGGVCVGRMDGDERALVVHWKGGRKQVGRGRKGGMKARTQRRNERRGREKDTM